MTLQADKKCPYCAEKIKGAASICRYCNRAVLDQKPCTFCCEPIRREATRCRYCNFDQQSSEKHPEVTGIVPASLSFGFQAPAYTPVYTPIAPKKWPEQCQAEEEFQQWRQRRLDAIAYGEQDE
jgi:hypothetical protein